MKRLVPGLNKLSGDEVYCHPVSVVDLKLGKGAFGGLVQNVQSIKNKHFV